MFEQTFNFNKLENFIKLAATPPVNISEEIKTIAKEIQAHSEILALEIVKLYQMYQDYFLYKKGYNKLKKQVGLLYEISTFGEEDDDDFESYDIGDISEEEQEEKAKGGKKINAEPTFNKKLKNFVEKVDANIKYIRINFDRKIKENDDTFNPETASRIQQIDIQIQEEKEELAEKKNESFEDSLMQAKDNYAKKEIKNTLKKFHNDKINEDLRYMVESFQEIINKLEKQKERGSTSNILKLIFSTFYEFFTPDVLSKLTELKQNFDSNTLPFIKRNENGYEFYRIASDAYEKFSKKCNEDATLKALGIKNIFEQNFGKLLTDGASITDYEALAVPTATIGEILGDDEGGDRARPNFIGRMILPSHIKLIDKRDKINTKIESGDYKDQVDILQQYIYIKKYYDELIPIVTKVDKAIDSLQYDPKDPASDISEVLSKQEFEDLTSLIKLIYQANRKIRQSMQKKSLQELEEKKKKLEQNLNKPETTDKEKDNIRRELKINELQSKYVELKYSRKALPKGLLELISGTIRFIRKGVSFNNLKKNFEAIEASMVDVKEKQVSFLPDRGTVWHDIKRLQAVCSEIKSDRAGILAYTVSNMFREFMEKSQLVLKARTDIENFKRELEDIKNQISALRPTDKTQAQKAQALVRNSKEAYRLKRNEIRTSYKSGIDQFLKQEKNPESSQPILFFLVKTLPESFLTAGKISKEALLLGAFGGFNGQTDGAEKPIQDNYKGSESVRRKAIASLMLAQKYSHSSTVEKVLYDKNVRLLKYHKNLENAIKKIASILIWMENLMISKDNSKEFNALTDLSKYKEEELKSIDPRSALPEASPEEIEKVLPGSREAIEPWIDETILKKDEG